MPRSLSKRQLASIGYWYNLPVSCFCYILSFKLIIHMLLIWLLLLRSPSSRRRSQALLVKPPAVDFIVRNFRVGLQHIRAEIVLLAIYLDLYQRRWVITRQWAWKQPSAHTYLSSPTLSVLGDTAQGWSLLFWRQGKLVEFADLWERCRRLLLHDTWQQSHWEV